MKTTMTHVENMCPTHNNEKETKAFIFFWSIKLNPAIPKFMLRKFFVRSSTALLKNTCVMFNVKLVQ